MAQIEVRFPDLCEPEIDAWLAPAARLAAALLQVSERALSRSIAALERIAGTPRGALQAV